MSETKPSYNIEGGTEEQARLEQLRAIHAEYGRKGKQPDEFTAKEYGKSVGCGYDASIGALQRAADAGKISIRKSGKFTFYRLVNDDD